MTQIERKLNLIAEEFINLIRERIRFRNIYNHKLNFIFDNLGIANDDYYEYKHIEREMSSIVRGILINKSLQGLFTIHGIPTKWVKNNRHLCFADAYVYEARFSGEFIVNNCIVRYTPLFRNDLRLQKILKNYKIKKIYIIDWTKEESYRDEKRCSIPDLSKYIEVNLSLKSFFIEFFSVETYNLFIDIVKKAVKTANNEIGFQTIPNLSLHHLSDFKNNRIEHFKKFDYKSLEYIHETTANTFRGVTKEDNDCVYNNFINNKLYHLFVCNSDFSKCFITSEYLYSIFKNGDKLDYTSIVSGYLKSIEQLIYELMKICLNNTTEELWITRKSGLNRIKNKDKKMYLDNNSRENPDNKGHYQISFIPESEQYFDTSLGSLIWFLHDYKNLWCLSKQSFDYIFGINGILQKYKQECRNEHFHKDNIYDYKKVERIRNNTILLFFLILGSIKDKTIVDQLYKLYQQDETATFDTICRKLMRIPESQMNFFIQFEGEPEIQAIKVLDQPEPSYDDEGSLKDTKIIFAKVNNFHIPDEKTYKMIINSKERRIIIDKNHIPKKMILVKYNGDRVEII